MTEEQVFLAALELPDAAARAAYLDEVCGQDAVFRRQIEALLEAHLRSGEFLNVPAGEQMNPGSSADYPVTIQSEVMSAETSQDDDSDNLSFLTPSTRPDSFGRIGHYEVLQVLGKGGFGIVFRAFDDVLQRVVAIKVMAPQLAATSPARKRFLREARTSAAVRHENVVQVYEVGELPLPHLAMEFIPGENLQQRLDRTGPLDVSETLRIGRQIAEGLAAAHATDLIHRDIKPGNVLLEGGQHKVKITDFGLARAADDASMTQSGMIAGTPMYMAPEQALGQTLDQRADLFSLGSVMYQMVSGRAPFRANTTVAVLKRVAEDTPRAIREITPETPQWLCDIITKLHAKKPEDRYQSAREVADVLANCESQLKEHSRIKDLSLIPRPPAQPAGWRKWAVAATTALIVLPFAYIAFGLAIGALGARWEALRTKQPTMAENGTPETTPTSIAKKQEPPPLAVVPFDAAKTKESITITELRVFTGHEKGVTRALFAPDNETIWTASHDRSVRQWNRTTGLELKKLVGHTLWVWGLAVSSDGKHVLSGSEDARLKRWDVTSGVAQTASGYYGILTNVKFFDKDRKAISTSCDTNICIWDLASLTCVKTRNGHSDQVWGLAVSRDETRAVTCSTDKTIIVWDLSRQKRLRTIDGHKGVVGFVDISPDGKQIVSSSHDGTVRVWDLDTGDPISVYDGHQDKVQGVAFSPDGRRVASSNYAGEVHLTDAATGSELARFVGPSAEGYSVAFSNDGTTILAAFADGTARLLQVAVKETETTMPPLAPGKLPPTFKNTLGMEFVLVPKGKSWLGGGQDKPGDVEVEMPADFYLGKYEVTQEEWRKVMGKNPSAYSREGGYKDAVKDISDADLQRFPLENVSIEQCLKFVEKLNKLERESGWDYRLPTELEWEYACRGGPMSNQADSTFDFYFARPTNTLLPAQANFNDGLKRPGKVGSYEPNALGLCDMHGNVGEWCEEWAVRGGGFQSAAADCRAENSWNPIDGIGSFNLGLRLVRVRFGTPVPEVKTAIPLAIAPFDAAQARAHQEAWAKHLGVPVEYTNTFGTKFMLIPPGEFRMGSPADEKDRGPDEGAVEVTLTKAFYLGTTEVTQAQWQAVMGTTPWKGKETIREGDAHPATPASWDDAQDFCKKLIAKEKRKYRLPTEAEWEFACRAGTTTAFSFGDDRSLLSDFAWFGSPIGDGVDEREYEHEVGLKKPNPFGLLDMHGSVSEWCADWFDPRYGKSPLVDPTGPAKGEHRVYRGGGWFAKPEYLRSASRGLAKQDARQFVDCGFRVVAEVLEK